MGDLSKNFSKRELSCPCCGLYIPNTQLIATLQTIRDNAGAAVRINSGTRCTKHNREAGSTLGYSPHMGGFAADIMIAGWSNTKLGNFIKALYKDRKLPYLQYCYKIAGRTNTAVHVSVDKLKARRSPFGF